MLSDLQKRAAQAIVNVFETGRPLGDYGKVTYHPRDTGQLTYGRSQTTLASGNLYLLLRDYCDRPESALGPDIRPYLAHVARRDPALNFDGRFKALLREAGDDPVMQETQDAFFDRVYWSPSLNSAAAVGVVSALGTSVVYDSKIHGSWHRMRDRTVERFGTVESLGETEWVRCYVQVRRQWLATHSNPLLHKTVYRMESFEHLIREEKWGLELPLVVRGVRIDEPVLAGEPVRISAEEEPPRMLRLQTPYLRGEDVRRLQEALSTRGYAVTVDGVFGPETDRAVRRFQKDSGRLKVDGIVGPATRTELGLES
ncbi:chitosanase [Desulfacinum infernum DSM 9756]|uniref:Chitosanase n=1 Tax=Desulfacinum infernum DSM 9756 TaxID=1121391 RepID=A0A1M5EG03_9BACT|nr:peptidoglycan-binding protein [Desulfacinum infernum]SHF78223.1 chitosanase [Desulfacinum infernum DSM 9756]